MDRRPNEHPLLPGQAVRIIDIVPARRPFMEGQAVIVAPVDGIADAYLVQFQNEPHPRRRLVFSGDWQSAPETMMRALTAMWRASLDPALTHTF